MKQDGTCTTCGEPITDIVEVIEHDCDRILSVDNLTRSEQDTLLYIESKVVDKRGELNHHQMNHEDMNNIKIFRASDILMIEGFEVTKFTDTAWELAKECRQARAQRMNEKGIELGSDQTE